MSDTPIVERVLGLVGAALVLVMAGYLLVAAWNGEGRGTPAVTVVLAPAQSLGGAGWVVPFRALNQGSAPAAGLRLEAELLLPDGRRERGEAVIDYLASGAEQEGGFFFATDPGSGRLASRALGYVQP
jgi:uncharacterized protein (TIGR02588 family)